MPYSLTYLEQAVTDHPKMAKLMINYFEEKFDPSKKTRSKLSSIKSEILSYFAGVKSIDQDRILRAIFDAHECVERENRCGCQNLFSQIDKRVFPSLKYNKLI